MNKYDLYLQQYFSPSCKSGAQVTYKGLLEFEYYKEDNSFISFWGYYVIRGNQIGRKL